MIDREERLRVAARLRLLAEITGRLAGEMNEMNGPLAADIQRVGAELGQTTGELQGIASRLDRRKTPVH
jgi:hypothetical protein